MYSEVIYEASKNGYKNCLELATSVISDKWWDIDIAINYAAEHNHYNCLLYLENIKKSRSQITTRRRRGEPTLTVDNEVEERRIRRRRE